MKIADLVEYFTLGIKTTPESRRTVGMEIETMFTDRFKTPISLSKSQYMFIFLKNRGWSIAQMKLDRDGICDGMRDYPGGLQKQGGTQIITQVCSSGGDTISYELGRHNLEVSLAPVMEKSNAVSAHDSLLLRRARAVLQELYAAAKDEPYPPSPGSAYPYFHPVMGWPEDLLVVPDARDALYVKLDGREALNILARTASVQFMYTVSPDEAITVVNNLNKCVNSFLYDGEGYPQEVWWFKYIEMSKAGYRSDPACRSSRYGGPREFRDIEDYCEQLALHDVITPHGLVPFAEAENIDIPLYLRSIWWHFRLRRFGNSLCVETRVQPRLKDEEFANQMWRIANAFEGRVAGPLPTKRDTFERLAFVARDQTR